MRAALLLLALALPARATTYTLSVSSSGPATALTVVTSTPSGIVCPPACSAVFAASATVTVGEVGPSTVAFAGWAGDPRCAFNAPSCTFALLANTSLTALFDPTLSVRFFGSGLGAVAVSSGTTATSAAIYGSTTAAQVFVSTPGATLVLTESTGAASAFVGWSGDGGCGRASTCTVTLNGSEVITATFTAAGSVLPLAVSVVPAAGGCVTSSPPGIATCAGVYSSTFTVNTAVHLATAAAAGFRFAGWANGGCAGLAPCVVTSTSPLQGLGGNASPAAYFFPLSLVIP